MDRHIKLIATKTIKMINNLANLQLQQLMQIRLVCGRYNLGRNKFSCYKIEI